MEPIALPPLILNEVDSTNRFAVANFTPLPDGLFIAARSQTAGRGRLGRGWISPPELNLTGTVVLKRVAQGFHGGCLAGVAALEMLDEAAPELDAYLKWPNDLYVRDRKLAGILSESAVIVDGHVTGVVTGIGLNVNLSPGELAKIDRPATSLLAETGREFDVKNLTQKLAKALHRCYITYLNTPEKILEAWRQANRLVGETVRLADARGGEHEGVFEGIARDGAMIFCEGGERKFFSSGDVRIDRDSVNWDRVSRKGVGK